MPRKPKILPSPLKIQLIEATRLLTEANKILSEAENSPEAHKLVIENDYGFRESLSAFLELSLPRLQFIRKQLGKV